MGFSRYVRSVHTKAYLIYLSGTYVHTHTHTHTLSDEDSVSVLSESEGIAQQIKTSPHIQRSSNELWRGRNERLTFQSFVA